MLECGVCEDVFSLQGDKVPRLLLCGHTVCHDCLTRLPLHGRAIRCPFDRQVTDLGRKKKIYIYNCSCNTNVIVDNFFLLDLKNKTRKFYFLKKKKRIRLAHSNKLMQINE